MDKKKEDIFKAVRSFINENLGITESKILGISRLEKDLRIYGEDAVEFVIAYGKKFNVDVSNFKAKDYFSPEGGIGLFKSSQNSTKKEITVNDLEKAIQVGRLDDEVINS